MSSLIYLGQVLSSCCFFYGSVWVLTTNVPRCIRVGVSARDVRVRAKAMLSGQNRPARLWKWKRNIHFNASPKKPDMLVGPPEIPVGELNQGYRPSNATLCQNIQRCWRQRKFFSGVLLLLSRSFPHFPSILTCEGQRGRRVFLRVLQEVFVDWRHVLSFPKTDPSTWATSRLVGGLGWVGD